MSISIPTLESVDEEYKVVLHEKTKAATELSRLMELFKGLKPGPRDEDARHQVARELAVVEETHQGAARRLFSLKLGAAKAAGAQLAADAGYQRQVRDALASWAETYGHWVALAKTVSAARQVGVDVQILPSGIRVEIEQMEIWLATAIRRGTLDADALPPPLRALLGDGR